MFATYRLHIGIIHKYTVYVFIRIIMTKSEMVLFLAAHMPVITGFCVQAEMLSQPHKYQYLSIMGHLILAHFAELDCSLCELLVTILYLHIPHHPCL